MKSKIGVVIPVLNYFQGFVDVVDSLNFKDELNIYVQTQYRHQVPLAAAWNKGFEDAVADGCKYVAILNDDVILSPDCLSNLAEFLDRHKDVALVSANNVHGQISNSLDILTYQEQPYDKSSFSEHPNYSAFMVRRDFFDMVGSFDENFDPAWYEDNDSHRRIVLLGHKAVCTTYASCVHLGSITSSMLPPDKRDSSASRAYYIKKWGGIPESHSSPDPKEHYEHPYNDVGYSPKDWVKQ